MKCFSSFLSYLWSINICLITHFVRFLFFLYYLSIFSFLFFFKRFATYLCHHPCFLSNSRSCNPNLENIFLIDQKVARLFCIFTVAVFLFLLKIRKKIRFPSTIRFYFYFFNWTEVDGVVTEYMTKSNQIIYFQW